MPNLMAYDVSGVQPMSGPTGLIFAMCSRYENQAGEEALFNGFDTGFSADYDATTGAYTPRTGAGVGGDSEGNNPALLNDAAPGTYEGGLCLVKIWRRWANWSSLPRDVLQHREDLGHREVQSTQSRVHRTGTRPQGDPWPRCRARTR